MNMLKIVLVFTRFTLIEMINNRLIYIAVLFSAGGLALASFIAEVALTDSVEIQLALLAASSRFCAVFVMMIFVVSSIVREFNDKILELYLSMPISRTQYLISKSMGFLACGILLSIFFSTVLLFYADPIRILPWGLSLLMELVIITAFSFLAVLTFNQQVTSSVFITFFFYLLCRSADNIRLIAESSIIADTLGNEIIAFMLKLLFLAIPALSRFTTTEGLIYGGAAAELPWLLAQTAIYVVLINTMALFDFNRKNI